MVYVWPKAVLMKHVVPCYYISKCVYLRAERLEYVLLLSSNLFGYNRLDPDPSAALLFLLRLCVCDFVYELGVM